MGKIKRSLQTQAHRTAILMTCLLCLSWCRLYSQWQAVFSRTVCTDTLYDIRSDKDFVCNTRFRFPEYSFYENIHARESGVACPSAGVKPLSADERAKTAMKDNEMLMWRRSFPQTMHPDTTFLLLRLLTRNVGHYTLYFHQSSGDWGKKDIPLPFEGYQIPVTEAVTPSNEICITATPIDGTQQMQFVIGELVLKDQVRNIYEVRHPFFQSLQTNLIHRTATHDGQPPVYYSSYLTVVPRHLAIDGISPQIEIRNTPGDTANAPAETDLLKRLVFIALDNYRFYDERHLDRQAIAACTKELFRKMTNASYCSLVDTLTYYINYTFQDPHFYIDWPQGRPCAPTALNTIKGPVRPVALNGKFFIAANFDTTYVPARAGDEILAIDHIPVRQVMDSLAFAQYHTRTPGVRQSYQLAAALLDRLPSDSCLIDIRDQTTAAIRKVRVKYNKRYKIPDNFRPIHCEYRIYDDNIFYYRINYWEDAVFLHFANDWDQARNARAIIFDLRGNGGGEMTCAMQLYAAFVDRPSIFLQFMGKDRSIEQVTVAPDKMYHFPVGRKVIILGDQSTACASEAFIRAMKQRPNTLFVASTATSGTLAPRYDIRLPSGVILHTNTLQDKICYDPNREVLEGKGIAPDVLVNLDNVADLRPYNDKLLGQALQLISADKRE